MATKPVTEILKADLPENWKRRQIVSPSGIEVGLTEQHGYNYLMKQVNAAQRAITQINNAFAALATIDASGQVEGIKVSVDDITGVLSPDKGGTGVTTIQALRNIMGLGDTLGALPLANGGTGATTAQGAIGSIFSIKATSSDYICAIGKWVDGTGWTEGGHVYKKDLRSAMGLGDTLGALPLANGGTGATSAGDAAVNLRSFRSFVDKALTANQVQDPTFGIAYCGEVSSEVAKSIGLNTGGSYIILYFPHSYPPDGWAVQLAFAQGQRYCYWRTSSSKIWDSWSMFGTSSMPTYAVWG